MKQFSDHAPTSVFLGLSEESGTPAVQNRNAAFNLLAAQRDL